MSPMSARNGLNIVDLKDIVMEIRLNGQNWKLL